MDSLQDSRGWRAFQQELLDRCSGNAWNYLGAKGHGYWPKRPEPIHRRSFKVQDFSPPLSDVECMMLYDTSAEAALIKKKFAEYKLKVARKKMESAIEEAMVEYTVQYKEWMKYHGIGEMLKQFMEENISQELLELCQAAENKAGDAGPHVWYNVLKDVLETDDLHDLDKQEYEMAMSAMGELGYYDDEDVCDVVADWLTDMLQAQWVGVKRACVFEDWWGDFQDVLDPGWREWLAEFEEVFEKELEVGEVTFADVARSLQQRAEDGYV